MGLKADNINVLVNMSFNQVTSKLQDILKKLKAESIDSCKTIRAHLEE
jgi:hypothetical protein